MTPGEMSTHKSQIAGNANYAFLCVLFGLHPLLIYDSHPAFQEQWAYRGELEQLKVQGNHETLEGLLGSPEVRGLKFPNCLSDLFEAIAGAIFVDLEGDLQAFSKVYLPLMVPLVNCHLAKDLKEHGMRHPAVEFSDLLGSHNCSSQQIIREGGTLKLIWHDRILAEVPIGVNLKHDQQELSRLALDNLITHSYLWDEICTCAVWYQPCNNSIT